MSRKLPNCRHCDARRTLSVVQAHPRGVIEVECSSCSKTDFLEPEDALEKPRVLDVSGNQQFDP